MRTLLLVIGIAVFVVGIKYKYQTGDATLIYIGAVLMILGVVLAMLYAKTGHIAKNDNDKTWIKLENSTTPQYLPKGKKASGINGIATQKGIFKVPNATSVKIDPDGNIVLTTPSKILNNILKLNAGFKDQNFVRQNPYWQELWKKHKEIS